MAMVEMVMVRASMAEAVLMVALTAVALTALTAVAHHEDPAGHHEKRRRTSCTSLARCHERMAAGSIACSRVPASDAHTLHPGVDRRRS